MYGILCLLIVVCVSISRRIAVWFCSTTVMCFHCSLLKARNVTSRLQLAVMSRAVFVRFSLGGSEFRLAMTDRATIAGMEVAKLVPWNSLLN